MAQKRRNYNRKDTMTVYLQSASGTVLSIYVDATTENRATGAAIRKATRDNGSRGWMALRCEHGRKVIR